MVGESNPSASCIIVPAVPKPPGANATLKYYYEKIVNVTFLSEVTLPALDKALCDRIPTNFNFLIYGNSRGSQWPLESQPPTYRLYWRSFAACWLVIMTLRILSAFQRPYEPWAFAPDVYLFFLVIQFQNLRKILGFFILILPLASRIIFSSPSMFTSL